MSWLPNLEDVYQPIPTKHLLKGAVDILSKEHHIIGFPKETLSDEHGTFAYRYGHFILCAKSYIYGNIVSFHRQIIGQALENKIKILLYLGNYKNIKEGHEFPVFYEFNPEDIVKDHEVNHKGGAEMLNCSIKLAKRYPI